MNYYEQVDGTTTDELIGGVEVPIIIHNVSVSANASLSRGELICADSLGVYSPATIEADAVKPLCIVAQDCTADSLGGVAQGYVSGVFNAEKVLVGGADSLTAEPFRQSLRSQGIYLTSLKDY